MPELNVLVNPFQTWEPERDLPFLPFPQPPEGLRPISPLPVPLRERPRSFPFPFLIEVVRATVSFGAIT